MAENHKSERRYDLEQRTLTFARSVRDFSKRVANTPTNREYIRQLIRSSASVGANYVEANEALSKRDFVHRIRISRKEVRESVYWLRLIETNEKERTEKLVTEGRELMYIFNAIIRSANK